MLDGLPRHCESGLLDRTLGEDGYGELRPVVIPVIPVVTGIGIAASGKTQQQGSTH